MATAPAITLDGLSLTIYQACSRRSLLDQAWRVVRWRPKSLLTSCLRESVVALSSGADSTATIQASQTRYLSQAANPGLDLSGVDPYTLAQDHCAILATTLTALSRLTLLPIHQPSPSILTSQVSWQPLSWADESGALHRWITVDRWDADELARELHSWVVFGDMAICDAPLTLHVVEIGQRRNSHQHTPWCRAYKHPMLAGRYKFQSVDGKGGHRGLRGEWKALWYAEQNDPDPARWVDVMDAEGVTPGLLHHIAIAQPSRESARQCREQILQEGERMLELRTRLPGATDGMRLPMSRGACDANHVACPWQEVCYASSSLDATGIAKIGLYQRRSSPRHIVSLAGPAKASATT